MVDVFRIRNVPILW